MTLRRSVAFSLSSSPPRPASMAICRHSHPVLMCISQCPQQALAPIQAKLPVSMSVTIQAPRQHRLLHRHGCRCWCAVHRATYHSCSWYARNRWVPGGHICARHNEEASSRCTDMTGFKWLRSMRRLTRDCQGLPLRVLEPCSAVLWSGCKAMLRSALVRLPAMPGKPLTQL